MTLSTTRKKPGYAVFKTGYITNGNLTAVASDASFFETHLIDGANPYPQAMQENIKKIQKRLMTFEEDFENAPDFSYPDGYTGTKIDFSGHGRLPKPPAAWCITTWKI